MSGARLEHRAGLTAGILMVVVFVGAGFTAFGGINEQVAQLDIDTARLADVIEVFGAPQRYLWGEETFTPDNLPEIYLMEYPNGFYVNIWGGWVLELRFESNAAGYVWRNGIEIGSSLTQVLGQLGQPLQTVVGQANEYADGVLYKDINGITGFCYYRRSDLQLRLFFVDYAVAAIFVTRTNFDTFTPPEEVEVVPYADVRSTDLQALDLSGDAALLRTLTYNRETLWPPANRLPAGFSPLAVMEAGKNPGLGVRALHGRGITGAGVNVAIIDQPLLQDHPEYNGKIAAYHDVSTGFDSSMHGPAVASLLVGTHCGTAPGATLFFVAAPSWTQDTAYQAAALDWIVEQNAALPADRKIRVVSVSAAPSGPNSPFTQHQELWDAARDRAEAAGIVVLDATVHRGLVGSCWYNAADPENVAACTPGYPGETPQFLPGRILAPASPRTVAQHYDLQGRNSYIYFGRGGLSWAIPYCAGVLAMGWQVNPDLSGERMLELLMESAHTQPSGAKIINPTAFIELVEGEVTPDVDSDHDGLTDAEEIAMGTDPSDPDSDGDYFSDGEEVEWSTDPLLREEAPFAVGDVDHSGALNAMDIQLVINGALGRATPCRTDLNFSGTVDAADVQWMINLVLNWG